MAAPIDASLPPNLIIGDGYTLRFSAIDPNTGAAITGVTVSAVTVQTEDLSGASGSLQPGPYLYVQDGTTS